MQNGFQPVIGYDEQSKDVSSLKQRLEREGHLWVIEDMIRSYLEADSTYTVGDGIVLTDNAWRLIQQWGTDAMMGETRTLIGELLLAQATKNQKETEKVS